MSAESSAKMNKPIADASRFWSEKTAGLIPYVPGEQPRGRSFIKLNTNENPYPPADTVVAAIKNFDFDRLRLYPDPSALDLRSSLSEYYGVALERIFVGNGSDEVLAFAFQAFFENKSRPVAFPDITYSFYPVYSRLYNLDWRTIPLDSDYRIRIEDHCRPGVSAVLANPNAPTAVALSIDEVEQIVSFDQNRLVIVDEAYVDFGAESAVPLLEEYDNLLIIQTFSKSRALAGMRVGSAMGSRPLIEGLERIRDSINSYTLDWLSQAAATAAVKAGDWFEHNRQKIISTREAVIPLFAEMGFAVLPSQANFIFVSHPRLDAALIYQRLREKGILVRHFNAPRIDQYLRISIGRENDMKKLVDALAEIIGNQQ